MKNALLLVLLMAIPALASAALPTLPELRLDLAGAGVRIVHPATSEYPAIARRLAADLGALTSATPAVVVETDVNALAGPGPLIVLGNLTDSAVGRRLYLGGYDFTDYAFPGPGGWALRTIRDPLGTGAPVLLVGGSDAAGVAEAARALVARVKAHGAVLGYVNDVQLGRWTTAEQLATARFLKDDDAVWQRVGQSGSWDYMDSIAQAGVGYLRTGDEDYLGLFRRELLRFIADDVYNPNPEAMQMLHGRLYVLLIVWDLVRDHPQFSEADRARVDTMFLHVARSAEGAKQITEVAATDAVRYNHHTRAGLDAYFVGRYFDRRYSLPEARNWLALAEKLFAPQLHSAKPACDSWGHQWAASLFNTLVYAMATGREDYAKSPAFKLAADRALIAYGRAAPRHYMAACAVASGDTGYLSLEPDLPTFARDSAQLRLVPSGDKELVTFTDEPLRTFTGSAPIVRRADLLGLGVTPLDAFWHDTIETPIYNPGGIFAVTVPQAEAFDKAALRDGWGAEDFYLLLDGISGGHHAYQDANCLVWLREGGVDWFTPQTGYAHSLGVRSQNGVNTALDGRGLEKIHRYARLLHHGTKGDFSWIGTSLDGVGAVDWERHILRRRGAWTLVIDRAVSSAGGELLLERFWYPNGECTVGPRGFTSKQTAPGGADIFLHLVSTIHDSGGGAVPMERTRAAVQPGGSVTVAGLLWTDATAAATGCRVERIDGGWRVTDTDGHAVEVALAGGGFELTDKLKQPAVKRAGLAAPLSLTVEAERVALTSREVMLTDQKITAVAGDSAHGYVVGTADGTVVACDASLHERWRARRPSGILSLERLGGDVVVGEEHGGLTRFDGAGQARWSVEIPWVTLPWAYWGEERSRIREIAVADLDGDGAEEILVSNADRRVYAFDGAGRELWKRPIEWGVFTAMWPGRVDGKFALAGGTSKPSIHGWTVLLGADGAVSGHRTRPDLTCWSLPSCTQDLQWTDIDGDEQAEIVCALDTNCRQLVAYRTDGAVKWDLDVAGAANAVVFDPVRRRVLCASAAGYIVAVDGASGQRVWSAWIGEPAGLLWVLGDGHIAAVTVRGRIFVLTTEGAVAGVEDLGAAVTAWPRPGNHRGAGCALMLGTADGLVRVLQ